MGIAFVRVEPQLGTDELGFSVDRCPAVICDICGKLIGTGEGNVVWNELKAHGKVELGNLLFVHRGECDDIAKQKYETRSYLELDKFIADLTQSMEVVDLIEPLRNTI